MKKNQTDTKVKLKIQADKAVVSSALDCTRILEILIDPPVKDREKERSPLNLSLVIDRSGSMSGDKLYFVKQAAAHVVDLLEEKDRASITIYDDAVETIFPSNPMNVINKTRAKEQIQRVNSGGSTNLSGGWLRGCEEAARGASESSINRTLLLTDGQANAGITDLEELSTHARELYLRQIATSCFGVGLGYNEHLLEAIATSGGGKFQFLETINAIPLAFEREFEELVNISLRDTEISLTLPQGVKAEVFALWHAETIQDHFNISLGSLASGKTQGVYVRLHFNGAIEGSESVIQVTVRGKGEGDYLCEDQKSFAFRVVSASEESESEVDSSLMERFAPVDMADQANEAMKRERAGDRAGASNLIQSSLREHRDHLSAPMASKFSYMATELSQGMDEQARKRHHLEEYEIKQGREVVRDYRLNLVNGHLIARIESKTILVDTGVPVSVGSPAEWYFLNEVHPLSQGFMGVDLPYLNRMVGTQIDILLGSDILKKYHLTLDLARERITFSARAPFRGSTAIPMTTFMGVPMASFEVAGLSTPMFIDTGAKLSYVKQQVAAQYPTVGKEKDFYPGMGEFETTVYEVPFQLGRLNFTLRCGVLPPLLEKTLFATGKQGIVGTELYQKYLVDLAFPDNAIYLK
ncbi:MAG: VWA domain-containing protein [Chloroflexi bacterium]|nr:VWA domain-containing protein [Chloroflexota bacterium]